MTHKTRPAAADRRAAVLTSDMASAPDPQTAPIDGATELIEDVNEALDAAASNDGDVLHEFCEDWAWWCYTRRYYARLSIPSSLLGRLQQRSARPLRQVGGPDAENSAALAAFHVAVLGQPADALDRQVFELYYIHRVKNVKAAAALLGIGRQHWYTLLRDFRRRAYTVSQDILQHNLAEGERLPHRSNTR